jgi:hypothetical protein
VPSREVFHVALPQFQFPEPSPAMSQTFLPLHVYLEAAAREARQLHDVEMTRENSEGNRRITEFEDMEGQEEEVEVQSGVVSIAKPKQLTFLQTYQLSPDQANETAEDEEDSWIIPAEDLAAEE